MNRWKTIRSFVLLITCLSVFSILGKIVFFPTPRSEPRTTLAPFVFPEDIPLPGWQFLSARPLVHDVRNLKAKQKLLASRLYEYDQGGRSLKIEMRYTIESSGNVMGFLGRYTDIPVSVIRPSQRIQRYQKGVGYYLLFTYRQQVYLTSCINPRGESTVTLPQFQQNRYRYDVWGVRLLRWLSTSENIRDLRCLWVLISIPSTNASSEVNYTTLEQVWVSWDGWWKSRFPES